MPNIAYHVINCCEGQHSKRKKLKPYLSEVCDQPPAASRHVLSTVLLDQESSHGSEVGTPSALEGPRFWLPVFWFAIIICSEVWNFNATYTTLALYHPTSLLCEVCEGPVITIFNVWLISPEMG